MALGILASTHNNLKETLKIPHVSFDTLSKRRAARADLTEGPLEEIRWRKITSPGGEVKPTAPFHRGLGYVTETRDGKTARTERNFPDLRPEWDIEFLGGGVLAPLLAPPLRREITTLPLSHRQTGVCAASAFSRGMTVLRMQRMQVERKLPTRFGLLPSSTLPPFRFSTRLALLPAALQSWASPRWPWINICAVGLPVGAHESFPSSCPLCPLDAS